MDAMAELIVATGPGAGKSTVARLLSGMFDPSALVCGDDFAMIAQAYTVPRTLPLVSPKAKRQRTARDWSGDIAEVLAAAVRSRGSG
jgi:cytidylate kinase